MIRKMYLYELTCDRGCYDVVKKTMSRQKAQKYLDKALMNYDLQVESCYHRTKHCIAYECSNSTIFSISRLY